MHSSMGNKGHGLLINMVTSSDLQCGVAELSPKLRQSVRLEHLFALTDHNAVLQHAKFSVPARREGYTVDDNARALTFAAKAQAIWPSGKLSRLQRKLLAFLLLMQSQDGQMHNLMDFSHRIIDQPSVGDHLGRAIWAMGAVINSDIPAGMKKSAQLVFDRALPLAKRSSSPRTKAYTCLGLAERIRSDLKDTNLAVNLKELAHSLLECYDYNRSSGWEWFEKILSYDNARLCQALFAAYQLIGEKAYLGAAEQSFGFLIRSTTVDNTFVPIGSDGWYVKGGKRAFYDQQPIEAGAMVETASLAYKLTSSKQYETTLRQALGWFYGMNTKSVTIYDDSTGACFDGITQSGLNENQGSESTLAYLLGAATFIDSTS
jgi:hypothetical protein